MNIKKLVFWKIFDGIYLLALNVPIFYLSIWIIAARPDVAIEIKLLITALLIVVITAYVYFVLKGIKQIKRVKKMNLNEELFDQYLQENDLHIAQKKLPLPHGYKKTADHISIDLKRGCPKAIICLKQDKQPLPDRYLFYEAEGLNQCICVIDKFQKQTLVLITNGPGYQTSL